MSITIQIGDGVRVLIDSDVALCIKALDEQKKSLEIQRLKNIEDISFWAIAFAKWFDEGQYSFHEGLFHKERYSRMYNQYELWEEFIDKYYDTCVQCHPDRVY